MGCGEEYWYDFDCRTGQYTKLSMCKCDRRLMEAKRKASRAEIRRLRKLVPDEPKKKANHGGR
jgi:hypothetical protein